MPLSQVLIAAGLVPVLVNVLLYVFSTADGVRTDIVRMPRALFWAGTIGGAFCLGLTVVLSIFRLRMLWSVVAVSGGIAVNCLRFCLLLHPYPLRRGHFSVQKAVLMCLPGVALTALAVWSIVEWCPLEVPCCPENADGVLICWAAAVCYWCFVVFAFHILNHAEKHPRLAALLIKQEELNI